MQLTGLSLGQLLLLLGAGAAVTTTLYLLKLRRRQVAVPYLGLWDQLLGQQRHSGLFANLRRLVSWLISLSVVALLAVALGDPRVAPDTPTGRHWLLLIDAGLTMQATDGEPTRLESALIAARRVLRSLPSTDRAMVAQFDSTTTPLSPFTDDSPALLESLSRVRPTLARSDLSRALDFAEDILEGRENAELVIISDGTFDKPVGPAETKDYSLRFIPVGKATQNLSLTALSARPYPLDKNRSELLVELLNSASEPREVELTLLGDGQAIEVERFTLEPRQRARRLYQDLSGVGSTLEARLRPATGQPDALPADDIAYATVPARERTRVLCVTENNLYLQAALLLDEYLDVAQIAPSDYVDGSGYDVLIFDRFVPPSAPSRPALYIHPKGARDRFAPLVTSGVLERPFFDRLKARHPLLRFTALGDVNLARALRVDPRPDDTVVAASANGPLIVAGRRSDQPFVALTFDIRESDLPLRTAWPLLLMNSIDYFESDGANLQEALQVGVPAPRALDEGAQLELVAPDGSRQAVAVEDGVAWLTPSQPGFHQGRGGDQASLVAVNLQSDAPRDITPTDTLEIAGRTASAMPLAPPRAQRPPWAWLLLIAAAVLIVEWLTYHRRWTV